MSRWTRFILAILVGVLAGLFYGWYVSPVEYVDTTLESLRVDYKSDYVLMVAEAFNVEKDPSMAARRLARLGPESPNELVREAILFAEDQGYTDADVALMRSLGSALEAISPPAVQGQAP
jgi:hypothetical protein